LNRSVPAGTLGEVAHVAKALQGCFTSRTC